MPDGVEGSCPMKEAFDAGTSEECGPGCDATATSASRPLPVLYADDALAVVDKPAGLMVHDSALARGETDFAADRLREQFGKPIFLVHRLDRATSGCLLLAFDRDTASMLGKTLMSRDAEKAAFEKDYLCVCRGWPDESFVVDHPLDGGPGKPLKKPAVTHFERLATVELPVPSSGFETSRYALLRALPLTGRFRQIRRHLKHVSHHLIGDTSHGDGRHNRSFRMLGIHRMLLHAQRLAFAHPHTDARIEAIAPLDAEFARAFGLFGEVVPDQPARSASSSNP
jgi:tRNA pseudouridine65 synthase